MKRFLLFMTGLVALMTGCDPQTGTDAGNGGGTGNNTPSGGGNGGATGTAAAELVSMDITDAESIYISTPTEAGETVSAKAGVTARTISERAAARGFAGSVLFKITKEGKAVEISLTWGNDKNENTAQLRPVAVYEAGTDYVITEFYNPTIRQSIAYLINKKSGKAYSLEEFGVPQSNGEGTFVDSPLVYSGESSLYYKTRIPFSPEGKTYDIVKINISDPANIWAKNILPYEDYLEHINYPVDNPAFRFVVDQFDNLIYVGTTKRGDSWFTKLITGLGGQKIVGKEILGMYLFRNADGNIYGIQSGESGDSLVKYVIDRENRTVTEEVVCEYGQSFSIGFSREIWVGEEMILLNSDSYAVVYSSDKSRYAVHSLISNISINACAASDTCCYIAGISDLAYKLVKIDLQTHTEEIIHQFDDYSVNQLAYTNGTLTFGATDLSDGRSVIGKYNPSTGDVKILEEASSSSATYLTPIN